MSRSCDVRSQLVALAATAWLLSSCGGEAFRLAGDLGGIPEPGNDAGMLPDASVELAVDLPAESAPALLADGVVCAGNVDCRSGFCVDGVCCSDACDGICASCSVAGNEGACTPSAAGTDADDECADQGAASCGKDGFCDGNRACRRYARATACAPAVCQAAVLTPAASCDGLGTCQKPAPVSCGTFQCQSATECATGCVTDADCTAPKHCFTGACGGLLAKYYNTIDFGALALTRFDATIDFDWMAGSPGTGVHTDQFSVRWTGTLTAKYSELYTFYIASNDGSRMLLDGATIIDNYIDQVATEKTYTHALQAGKSYTFLLEYYEKYTNASIKLSWSSPSQPKTVIPTEAFSPP